MYKRLTVATLQNSAIMQTEGETQWWESMMTMMNLKNLLELPMQVQMRNTIYCIVVSSLLCSPSVDNPSTCEKSSDLPASIIL